MPRDRELLREALENAHYPADHRLDRLCNALADLGWWSPNLVAMFTRGLSQVADHGVEERLGYEARLSQLEMDHATVVENLTNELPGDRNRLVESDDSTWEFTIGRTADDSSNGYIFDVREVYYDSDGNVEGYSDDVSPASETSDGLRAILRALAESKQVYDMDDRIWIASDESA